MLLADRAAQLSLDSHFLLACNKHQYFLFRLKEFFFYLKASKRHKRKPQPYPCPAQILATNNKSDSLSSPFQCNGCCVWCPILQVHHTGFLNQLNCFREPLHLLQGTVTGTLFSGKELMCKDTNQSNNFFRFQFLFTNL